MIVKTKKLTVTNGKLDVTLYSQENRTMAKIHKEGQTPIDLSLSEIADIGDLIVGAGEMIGEMDVNNTRRPGWVDQRMPRV